MRANHFTTRTKAEAMNNRTADTNFTTESGGIDNLNSQAANKNRLAVKIIDRAGSISLNLSVLFLFVFLLFTSIGIGQTVMHNDNNADQSLRSSGRVNPSTLGLEMSIPLGAYPGRGINIPVSVSYSSKVWRMDSTDLQPNTGGSQGSCVSINRPEYSENAASGWTSSMGVAYVEYVGKQNIYDQNGNTFSPPCDPYSSGTTYNSYIKRIQVHLPSGESHELRSSDTPVLFLNGSSPNFDFSGMFYAVDGSKLKFDGLINRLYLPDGSFYDFGAETNWNSKIVRKATLYKDINGNQLTFNAANGTYLNGSWTDTVGRTIPVPLPLETPTTLPIGPVYYTIASFNGGTMTYKFHWKQLKGSTAAESGLTDFNQSLKHKGDRNANPTSSPRTSSTALFHSDSTDWAVSYDTEPLFNPIVVTAIELPDGRKYEFSYNIYGEIEHITYPTGGEEDFTLANVLSVGTSGNAPQAEANRGVTRRDVQESSSASAYIWTYSTTATGGGGGKVTTNNPDGTKTEQELKKDSSIEPKWGFSDVLAGMPIEERAYSSTSQIISNKKTTWTKTELTTSSTTAKWHPRVTKVESILYDLAGNYVSSSSTMDYAGNLNDITNSVDVNLTKEYGFTTSIGSLGALQRQSEVTYLEYDTTILQTTRDAYKAKQLVSLPTKIYTKNSGGTIVAKTEVYYDETGYSGAYLGNATRAKMWLDTNNTWIETRAKYDTYGRVTEATDPKGNITTTEYSAAYSYLYPTKVTAPIPDPTNTNGSNIASSVTTTYDMTTGLALSTTDSNGQTTTMEYNDPLLRPTKVTPPAGSGITETEYGAGTNSSTQYIKNRVQIDATNWKESYSYYDGLGRIIQTQTIDSNGDIFIDTLYDSFGRVDKVSNPYRSGETVQWTQNVYDVAGRAKEVITPDGAKVQTAYNIANAGSHLGVYRTITDQAGKHQRFIKDSLDNITRVDESDAAGNLGTISSPVQPTTYTYDTVGNLKTVTQGVQTRTFNYDSLSRMTSVVNPESGTASYTYDAGGNLLTKTDARNITTTVTYDNLNRVKTRSYSDTTPTVTYYYDGTGVSPTPNYANGLLTKISSSVSTTEYSSFDNLGRVLAHRQTTGGTAYNTAYTYNLSGALIEETYPSGRMVKNTLDADGGLALVQTKTAGGVYQTRADNFTYASHGAISLMKLGNNRWESTQFNNRLQPTQIALGTYQNGTDQLKLDYSYGTTNNSGNVLSQTITVPTAGGNAGFTAVQNYTYDTLNRIKSATETVSGSQTWKQMFNYDRYGNRNFDAANTTTISGCPTTQCNPNIDTTNNRFSSGQGYTYDLAGNIITDAEGRTFIYDAENKQSEVKNSSNVTVGSYYYDGDGKRVRKVTASEETVFVYDTGGMLVAEYSSLIPQTTPITKYLTNDHLGSPRIITDGSGNVLSRRDFAPFGEELYIGYGSRQGGHGYTYGDSTSQKFTGYQKDEETDLDFAEARMNNSQVGRFTSPDPLMSSAEAGLPQSWNRYIYVMNNPLNLVDPSGMKWGYINTDGGGRTYYWKDGNELCDGCTEAPIGWTFANAYVNGRFVGEVTLLAGGNIKIAFKSDSGIPRGGLSNRDLDAIRDITGGLICDLSMEYLCLQRPNSEIADNVQTAAAIVQTAFLVKSLIKAGFNIKQILAMAKKGKLSCCFVAGTPIQTEDGLIPIEELEVGDMVLSYNEKIKEIEYKPVAHTFIDVKENIVKIKIENEQLLTTTTEHPFYVKKSQKARNSLSSDDEGGEWLIAEELRVGQKVLRPDGNWTPITEITRETKPTLVYNLEVENNHNYFVGEVGVLTHNCNLLAAGKNFKDHFRHSKRNLLKSLTGNNYRSNNDAGQFLVDMSRLIGEGTVEFAGKGSVIKGGEMLNVYRGKGVTVLTKTLADGAEEYRTILKTGEGMDKKMMNAAGNFFE